MNPLFVLRPMRQTDADDLYQMALAVGYGMTSLLADRAWLYREIKRSEQSFHKIVQIPNCEKYLFALEDYAQKKIMGVCGIEARVGGHIPVYSYKLTQQTVLSKPIDVQQCRSILHLANDYQAQTELCSLYLSTQYRIAGLGSFLSKARLLYIAAHQQRFQPTVFATMRGQIDRAGQSPFWQGLLRHFIPIPFTKASELTVTTDKQFIADLMPQHPIYVDLLPKYCQRVIGKPHRATIPAMHILLKEGLQYQNYIDIFDGGPILASPLPQIHTVRNSQYCQITKLTKTIHGTPYMVCTTEPFRATCAPINHLDLQTIELMYTTAEQLQVQPGSTLLVAPL